MDRHRGELRSPPSGAALDMVIVTGQSLAAGRAPAISRAPVDAARALRLAGGPVGEGDRVPGAALIPLVEEDVETVASGFAAQLLAAAPERRLLIAGQAEGGQPYRTLRKGGPSGVYERILRQVETAAAVEPSLRVRAILLLHGETDGALGNLAYDRDLVGWLEAFDADLADHVSAEAPPPLLICQTSSVSGYCGGASRERFRTPFLQLVAAEAHPRILLVGPKYQYDYVDWAHIDAPSTRAHGELFAKAYKAAVVDGAGWRPLCPDRISVDGRRVAIDFHVPVAPLVLDSGAVDDPGHAGFDLVEAAACRIVDVAVTGPERVTVVLSESPPPGARLTYAFHNGEEGVSGRRRGARGCLRDSDPTPSVGTGEPIRNWCVAFEHRF